MGRRRCAAHPARQALARHLLRLDALARSVAARIRGRRAPRRGVRGGRGARGRVRDRDGCDGGRPAAARDANAGAARRSGALRRGGRQPPAAAVRAAGADPAHQLPPAVCAVADPKARGGGARGVRVRRLRRLPRQPQRYLSGRLVTAPPATETEEFVDDVEGYVGRRDRADRARLRGGLLPGHAARPPLEQTTELFTPPFATLARLHDKARSPSSPSGWSCRCRRPSSSAAPRSCGRRSAAVRAGSPGRPSPAAASRC